MVLESRDDSFCSILNPHDDVIITLPQKSEPCALFDCGIVDRTCNVVLTVLAAVVALNILARPTYTSTKRQPEMHFRAIFLFSARLNRATTFEIWF